MRPLDGVGSCQVSRELAVIEMKIYEVLSLMISFGLLVAIIIIAAR